MAETLGFPVPLRQRFRPLSITCPGFLTTCPLLRAAAGGGGASPRASAGCRDPLPGHGLGRAGRGAQQVLRLRRPRPASGRSAGRAGGRLERPSGPCGVRAAPPAGAWPEVLVLAAARGPVARPHGWGLPGKPGWWGSREVPAPFRRVLRLNGQAGGHELGGDLAARPESLP